MISPGDSSSSPRDGSAHAHAHLSNVLWIDDEPTRMAAIAKRLRQFGCAVRLVDGGESGLATLEAESPEVVILDWRLAPGRMSGAQILERLRRDAASIPVLVLTGYLDEAIAAEAIRLGAAIVRGKPIHAYDLFITLCGLARASSRGPAVSRASPADADEDPSTERERPYVADALAIIGRRFGMLELDRAAIAREVRLSADYLGRLMKHYVGHGLLEQVHLVRVTEAARLLRETRASVYAIARDCGYHTTGELDEHFKRVHGCTPTEFRQRRG